MSPRLYSTIVADPPWNLETVNAGWKQEDDSRVLPYSTMPLEQVKAMDVEATAAAACHLWLWVPLTFLWEVRDVARAWGFEPRQLLVWCKPGLGMGGRFRQNCEYVLFAQRGSNLPITRRDVGTWHAWPRGRHSEKPDAFYDLVESVSPGPYLELFARRRRLGWDAWGDEVGSDVEIAA